MKRRDLGRSSAPLHYPAAEKDACGVGWIAKLKGKASRRVVQSSLEMLERLAHRGAVGSDPMTGDGAGILLQIPDAILRRVAAERELMLPEPGRYALAMLFMPRDPRSEAVERRRFEEALAKGGLWALFWREVPIELAFCGSVATKERFCNASSSPNRPCRRR